MNRQGSLARTAPRLRVVAALVSAAGLLAGALGITVGAHAAGIPLTDVAASITAPPSASAPFDVTGTITNTGALNQPAGSTVRITPSGGAVTAAPTGCALAAGAAVCTAGSLNSSGGFQSFTVTVAPNAGVSNVHTVVETQAAFVEISVPPPNPNDDSAAADTGVTYPGLNVTISSNPGEVRNGYDTLLTTTVSTSGVPNSGTVNINTGLAPDPTVDLPAGCSASGAVISCPFSVTAGNPQKFDVAAKTDVNAASLTSSATANGFGGSSSTASVVTTESPTAAAFVPDGTNLSFTSAPASDTFNVPTGSAVGLILRLGLINLPSGTMCGTAPCKTESVEALFDNSGTYSGNDINNPFVWAIAYSDKQSCNGLGTPSGCLPIYWIGSGKTTPQQIGLCPTYAKTRQNPARMSDPETPCLNFVNKTTSGLVTYYVALLKDITIPIVSGK